MKNKGRMMKNLIISITYALCALACASPPIGGIGVVYKRHSGKVVEVFKGSPAEEAGIKEGDVITNYNQLKGEIGTSVDVKVKRNDVDLFEKTLRRMKIIW